MGDGILSDTAIHEAVRDGRITIEPFRTNQVNPTSYDVTLGDTISVYEDVVSWPNELWSGSEDPQRGFDGSTMVPLNRILDIRRPLRVRRFLIDRDRGWVFNPGIGYLMHTAERISTNVYVPVLDGKSSIGRLFVSIHETAGYGDPGFNGQFTLEVTCTHPVRIYPGMRIGQVRFHTIVGPVEKLYSQTGKYKGNLADGPIPSQVYRAFEE